MYIGKIRKEVLIFHAIHMKYKKKGLVFFENLKKKNFKMSSAAVVIGPLRVNTSMCLFHMHFCPPKKMVYNPTVCVFFKNDFAQSCHMTLPLQACPTVTSTRFHHVGARENLTYTRNANSPELCTIAQGCI